VNTSEGIDWKAPVRAAAEAIAREGTKVRAKIAEATSRAASRASEESETWLALPRAVLEGAARGVEGALPDRAESVLREVVDGLADGLATSALAAKLALEEARGRGAQYAEEDLRLLRGDLRDLGGEFARATQGVLRTVRTQVAGEAKALGEHAKLAFDRATPAVESALRAAVERQDDVAFERLNRLFDTGPPSVVGWNLPIEPWFTPLHGDSRWAALLSRLADRAR